MAGSNNNGGKGSGDMPSSARRIALKVLGRFDPQKRELSGMLGEVLGRCDKKAHLSELVFGVTKNRIILDRFIGVFSSVQPEHIEHELLNILRIGVYELVFTPDTPVWAIVNEAVCLAGLRGSKKKAGFVNAIMRKLSGSIEGRPVPLERSDRIRTIPISPGQGCLLAGAILPDPAEKPDQYLAEAFSIPLWLIQAWIRQFGPEKTTDICFASNRRPSIYLNPNTAKITAEELLSRLLAEGFDCRIVETEGNCNRPDGTLNRPGSGLKMIKITPNQPVSSVAGFEEGYFTVQDPTSAMVVDVVSPQPGWTVLDICAAPGTKTAQMGWYMKNTGTIIATDRDSQRLSRVADNCRRLGIDIVEVIEYDKFCDILLSAVPEDKNSAGRVSSLPPVDAVLLDVPCSNSGVLARRPEVRWRIRPAHIDSLSRLQTGLLERACHLVRPGGLLCYSTCSILSEENDAVVERFLSGHPCFALKSTRLAVPKYSDCDFDYDGGFLAIMSRR